MRDSSARRTLSTRTSRTPLDAPHASAADVARVTPAASAPAASTPGKRKAVKHAARPSVVSALPPVPVLAGVAVLAVAVGGALASPTSPDEGATVADRGFAVASALTGDSAVARASLLADRRAVVSRDSRRDALEDAADADLLQQAEAQAKERNAALAAFAQQAEVQAKKIAANQWVLPLDSYRLTNTFGMAAGYYSSGYHTGLDFAAPSGTPIKAVANGTITETGYDGAYGNKTVLTLEDGTELWFCHQTAFAASVGQTVRAGEVIGYVGSTGNSFGPHLHLEVRPGAGDPVDPFQALAVNGVTP
ncbi:peptidoglycan DD-metalloendopeptidase family protein [Nocardioides perillae]|uniref:Murein DD-endopeptidase MepM/ murein hydrolase activator NlpD n=1 Tax=Nocardioides perillae TaxID=1119534 RepID=A0A7Y9RTM8_9ACTN|nr:murein DD-endopeptidase MepM/ murein hydrolase activator NlpD [Nocardioides perillae]